MRGHLARLPAVMTGMWMPVAVILLLELLALHAPLEYRRALLAREPWRLLTGHFVHLSLVHAMLNAVALLLLARLFQSRLRASEQWLLLLLAPVVISLAFWVAMPALAWYRGLSGALHATFFAGCIVWLAMAGGRERWLPVAALAAGAVKVLAEQPWPDGFPWREWLGGAVVPQAHLIGAAIGTFAGICFAKRGAERGSDQRVLAGEPASQGRYEDPQRTALVPRGHPDGAAAGRDSDQENDEDGIHG